MKTNQNQPKRRIMKNEESEQEKRGNKISNHSDSSARHTYWILELTNPIFNISSFKWHPMNWFPVCMDKQIL